MEVRLATPPGYELPDDDVARLRAAGVEPVLTNVAADAVEGVDAVYTDVWASMGQEAEADLRREAFAGFTVDQALMVGAHDDAVFLHCLPAHRGEEVSSEVLEGPQSRVWPQATNRMHAARGALAWLLEHR
jgi:ornithine carbamoyltransferase